MSKPEIGAGDVSIELDGQTIVLKPTAEVCAALCRAPGGLYRAPGMLTPSIVDRLLACDLDTIAFVIRTGLGLGPQAVKDLEARIYRTGIVSLREPLCAFVGIVANGGRPPATTADGEDADSPPDQAAA